jgi:leucyl aminopeptidase (aminopeptidase T)
MLREYPVTLAPTKFSLTHCAAVKEAKEAGARIATLPGIDNDVFSRCLNASPEELKTTGEKWMEKLKGHKKVKITSPAGTDLEFGIGTHPVVNDDGRIRKKFSCGNLPAGEVYTAPDVGSANGTLVIDGSMGSFQWNENDSPAVIEIKNGSAVSFSGPRGIELEKALSEHGPGGFILAEFGIGTNPEAKLSGNLLEDEKVKGTVHLAFGNNCGFGGENDVQIHIDGLVLNPDVSVDSVKLMKKGKWYV